MSIFKAYDIRGVYPEEINEDWAYKIGRAFAAFLKKEVEKDDIKIVLSMDCRLSSESLYEGAKRGLIDEGVDVVCIGLASTPMFYFGVANYGFDGGVSVTASHNPGQYNGFKMVKKGAKPVGEASGLKEIENIATNGIFEAVKDGSACEKSILNDYFLANNFFNIDYDFKVLIDTANGIAGLPVEKILKNDNFISIFPELDGRFPNHDPDPLKKGNLDDLCQRVIDSRAGLGIAFDGDGDRVFFVDEKGQIVFSDLVLALVAEILLKQNKGCKILYDIRCSNIVKEVVESNGGIAIMNRVGHTFIKERMHSEDIIFGGEYSGHFYSKRAFYAEDPFFVISIVLDEIKKQGKTFSQIMEKYKKYYHSGEINFKVNNKDEIVKNVQEKYTDGKLSLVDGIRIDFDDWWLSLRSSNTEPLLRLIIEAKTEELLLMRVRELSDIIES